MKAATAGPGASGRPWDVKLHREVAKDVAHYGLSNLDFSPTLAELLTALESNPKQFPKKRGRLKDARAADLKYRNVTYRAVFVLNETARLVKILSLAPHDVAYDEAARRV